MAETNKSKRGSASSTKSSSKVTKKSAQRTASTTTSRPVKTIPSTTTEPAVTVHKTASGPTSALKSKSHAVVGASWKTVNKRSFWFWIGGILAAVLIVLTLWWQWQRSYVGIVNGQYIPTTSLYAQLMANGGAETLNNIAQQQLILQQAERDNVSISNDEIEAELDKFIESTGGKDQYQASLKEFGISEELLRNQIEVRLSLEKILADDIKVSDQEIEDYYNANKEEVDVANEGLEAARKRIETQLREQKLNQASANFIESLQQGGTVQTMPYHASLTFGQFLEDEVFTIPSEVWSLITGNE